VLFKFIGARYEHRSTVVTANYPFGYWTKFSKTAAPLSEASPK